MKTQAGFELYFSVSAFVLVVVYIFFELLKQYPTYFDVMKYETLKAEAYQLSEILIDDPGDPVNWYEVPTSSIKRIGLNDEKFNKTNLISAKKAHSFNSLCSSNPDTVKNLLDFNEGFAVYLRDSDGNLLISCENISSSHIHVEIKRIVAIYNHTSNKISYGELILELS